METKAMTKLLLAILDNNPQISQPAYSDLPPDSRAALKEWVCANHLSTSHQDTTMELYEIAFPKFNTPAYVASYSGDDPIPFLATVVIQNGQVVGSSVDVAE